MALLTAPRWRRPAPVDAGLQVERTAMAWSRTVLAGAVLCGLVVRLALPGWGAAVAVLPLACGGLAVVAHLAGWRRAAVAARAVDGGSAMPGGALPIGATGAVLSAALLLGALVWQSSGP
ncbi:MAG: DUF202 domain-containing protein [Pseudonocardia sp.]